MSIYQIQLSNNESLKTGSLMLDVIFNLVPGDKVKKLSKLKFFFKFSLLSCMLLLTHWFLFVYRKTYKAYELWNGIILIKKIFFLFYTISFTSAVFI